MQTRLSASRELFEAGQVERARSAAAEVLKDAQAQADPSMQGLALMALAQYDRVVGRFRRAIDTAQQAVRLFQLHGDIAGEASALSLVAHSSSILGRDEESVEAALLGVKLVELLPPGPRQVIAHNYLGVAYLWSRSFGNAESSLREAERLALLYAPESNVLLPRTNLAWLEAMRLFQERYFSAALPNTDTLRQRLAACTELFESDAPFAGLPGVRAVLQRFGRLTWALYLCWHGELEAAHKELAAAQDRSKPGQYAQVADVIVHWVRAELHWAERDLQAAQYEATLLTARAGRAEFEQMAFVGHLLLTQILDSQGQYALALAEERAHRRRELRVRADILDSRHRVVQTQLDIRTSERHLQQLALHSQELERLSFEDSLTAIANRRRFEQQLASALADGPDPQHPVCVALIDLDEFKRVNDTYCHAAGDDVLRAVAQAIKAAVRESDLPARYGGDEFVVLFPRTTLDMAQQVCGRIHAAVAELRWERWSPALQVSVSIGVSQAQAGDTGASLIQRSDVAMFGAKTKG